MKTYDLIFSERFFYRFLRHLLFWIVWFVYILIVYLLAPSYSHNSEIPFAATFYLVAGHLLIYYTFSHFLIITGSIVKKIRWGIIGLVVALFVKALYGLSIESLYEKPRFIFLIVESIRDVTYNVTTLLALAIALKYGMHWFQTQQNQQTLIKEKSNAELQLLKAQIHPHFLFNTLNNIYSFILSCNPIAPELILKLSNLMRYIITECNHAKVQLGKEIEMIESYLELEKIRYGERLVLDISITGNPEHKSIAPLLLLPFIENSFKHGASNQLENSWIKLEILISEMDLTMKLANSKSSDQVATKNKGIGLVNVQKRLTLLYPHQHTLSINSESGVFTIYLKLALEEGLSHDYEVEEQPYLSLIPTA